MNFMRSHRIWLAIASTVTLASFPATTSAQTVLNTTAYAAVLQPIQNQATETYQGSFFDLTVEDMLERLGVQVAPEDKLNAFPDPALGLGSVITIERAPVITITDAGVGMTVRSWASTVGDLLEERHLELLGKDQVNPALDTTVSDKLAIKITRVSEVEVTKTEPVSFTTKKTNSADLEKGQTETKVAGVAGAKEVTYLIRRVDGKETSRTITKSVVTKPPVTEELIIGIGPKLVKSGVYMDLLNAAAKKYLINATALQCLMIKESGGGANTGYPDATYKGLFQYTDGYWKSASAQAGYSGASVYNAEAQIFATAKALSSGQSGRWPPYASCKDK